MKAKHHTTETMTLKCLLPVLVAAALNSCGTRSVALTEAAPASDLPGLPVRVWHRDPPELPRGVADDAATNGWEGMWGGTPIEFDDVQDADAIIPVLRVSMAL